MSWLMKIKLKYRTESRKQRYKIMSSQKMVRFQKSFIEKIIEITR